MPPTAYFAPRRVRHMIPAVFGGQACLDTSPRVACIVPPPGGSQGELYDPLAADSAVVRTVLADVGVLVCAARSLHFRLFFQCCPTVVAKPTTRTPLVQPIRCVPAGRDHGVVEPIGREGQLARCDGVVSGGVCVVDLGGCAGAVGEWAFQIAMGSASACRFSLLRGTRSVYASRSSSSPGSWS
ncbi:MAG: hypothetical protein KatS3mg114_1307 [Planctomycetaceae bacterium]|nr:MAG: hypothetical protein KatS3mg114_1307 [Planctomycetaceae bacterium]